MRPFQFLLVLLLAANMIIGMALSAGEVRPPHDQDVEELLARMSLEEKIGQMVQIDLSMVMVKDKTPIQLDPARLREAVLKYKVGSILNNGPGHALSLDEWHYVITTIQDVAVKKTPNKIPVLYGIDSIHGASYTLGSTLFPQHIALAATRSPELVQKIAEVSALETRASGIRWVFAPVLGVGRQAYWARFPETYGEDPLLTGTLGAAEIRGFEGNDISSAEHVAACMKHYMGYSLPFNGKDRSPALIPDPELREYFLPPFQDAVKAGVRTVMINSGEVNGVPAHASRYLLTDILRDELGFTGVAVSDWEDVIRLHTWHAIADTPKEAVRLAVEAGLDMSMVPMNYSFFGLLKQLVEDGDIPESRIDNSVRRILRLKYELGLFQNPYPETKTRGNFGKPEYRQLALTAAEEAITLLKNEQESLPLAKDQKLLVAGPAADSITALNGCWSYTWQGNDPKWYPRDAVTIVGAIRDKIGKEKIIHRQGVGFDGQPIDLEQTVKAAAKVDAIILCLGEDAYCEGQGDINLLDLPEGQQELARRLYATGRPVILVLVEGRGRIIREIEPDARGILLAYWPGIEGGRAIANVVFGDTNPSGKLPFTYNRHSGNLLTYDRKYTSRLNEASAPGEYNRTPSGPQYEFGHGLSYTTFDLRNLQLSEPKLHHDGTLTVSVEVSNTGNRAGREVVELYTRDLYASIAPPGRRLRAFKKVALEPGQTRKVEFELNRHDLAFVNARSRRVTEPGEFEVMIGNLKTKFRYQDERGTTKTAALTGSATQP